jgi:membrane fusion protein (multidrug efflux system)
VLGPRMCGVILAGCAAMTGTQVLAQDGRSALPRADSISAELRAQLTPRDYTTLASEIAGRIVQIKRRTGEHFKRGDTLIEFDCAIQNAQVGRAKAVEIQSEKTLAINRRLVQLKSIGQLELEVSEAEVAKAKADLDIAESVASKCRIFAPFGGVIADQKAREFQYASPGQPLLDILDDRNLDVELIVPSRWIGWLKADYPFRVHIDELNKDYAARVTRLGGRVDPVSQSIRIFGEITDPATELLAGMSGRATIAAPR